MPMTWSQHEETYGETKDELQGVPRRSTGDTAAAVKDAEMALKEAALRYAGLVSVLGAVPSNALVGAALDYHAAVEAHGVTTPILCQSCRTKDLSVKLRQDDRIACDACHERIWGGR